MAALNLNKHKADNVIDILKIVRGYETQGDGGVNDLSSKLGLL
jgi:hypothetical protein